MSGLHRRVGEALDDLASSVRDQNVVVVTHATPIKSAVAWLLGGDAHMILRLHIGLASVTAFRSTSDGPVLTDFNWSPACDGGHAARDQGGSSR